MKEQEVIKAKIQEIETELNLRAKFHQEFSFKARELDIRRRLMYEILANIEAKHVIVPQLRDIWGEQES